MSQLYKFLSCQILHYKYCQSSKVDRNHRNLYMDLCLRILKLCMYHFRRNYCQILLNWCKRCCTRRWPNMWHNKRHKLLHFRTGT